MYLNTNVLLHEVEVASDVCMEGRGGAFMKGTSETLDSIRVCFLD
jgi:hypothetical protein